MEAMTSLVELEAGRPKPNIMPTYVLKTNKTNVEARVKTYLGKLKTLNQAPVVLTSARW